MQFKLDSLPFSLVKRALLWVQVRFHLYHIKKQDKVLWRMIEDHKKMETGKTLKQLVPRKHLVEMAR